MSYPNDKIIEDFIKARDAYRRKGTKDSEPEKNKLQTELKKVTDLANRGNKAALEQVYDYYFQLRNNEEYKANYVAFLQAGASAELPQCLSQLFIYRATGRVEFGIGKNELEAANLLRTLISLPRDKRNMEDPANVYLARIRSDIAKMYDSSLHKKNENKHDYFNRLQYINILQLGAQAGVPVCLHQLFKYKTEKNELEIEKDEKGAKELLLELFKITLYQLEDKTQQQQANNYLNDLVENSKTTIAQMYESSLNSFMNEKPTGKEINEYCALAIIATKAGLPKCLCESLDTSDPEASVYVNAGNQLMKQLIDIAKDKKSPWQNIALNKVKVLANSGTKSAIAYMYESNRRMPIDSVLQPNANIHHWLMKGVEAELPQCLAALYYDYKNGSRNVGKNEALAREILDKLTNICVNPSKTEQERKDAQDYLKILTVQPQQSSQTQTAAQTHSQQPLKPQ